LTLFDAAMKSEKTTKGTIAIGEVMMEIWAEED
jgi:hypothetical protein